MAAAHAAAQDALASVRSAADLGQLQHDAEEEAATHKRLQQDLEDARARGAAALTALNHEHAAQAAAQAEAYATARTTAQSVAQTAARVAAEEAAYEQTQQVERDAAKIEAASQAALARMAAATAELAQVEQDASAAEDAVREAAERLAAARQSVMLETAALEEATRDAAARKIERQKLAADESKLALAESGRGMAADRPQTPAASSPRRAHWGWFGLGGAFAGMVMTMYIVPRIWPEQTAIFAPAVVQAPAPAAAPVTATVPAAPATLVTLPPLYPSDSAAQRDLTLSYELKSVPKEKP